MSDRLKARNPCNHGGHVTTCPECIGTDPIVTTQRELEWFRKFAPDVHRVAIAAIKEGRAIVTREAAGCRAL